jgi:hypothetical protein
MATAVFSFKVDADGKVTIAHVFFGATKTAAEAGMRHHAEICPKYGPAFRSGETIEFAREIAELPPADGDDLEDWLDEMIAGDGDDAEDDPIEMEREE